MTKLGLSVFTGLLVSLSAVLGSAPAAAQARSDARVESPTIERMLADGDVLERDRRWGDALAHYDKAIKQFPQDQRLQTRHLFARMHYDLGRRYADDSFRRSLQMTPTEAAALYTDLTLKIESHYVHAPNWKTLVAYGTTNFEIALTDEVFLNRHLRGVSADNINNFRRELRDRLAATPVRSRTEARDAVNLAAWMAEQQLRLPRTVVILEYACGAANTLDDYSSFLTSGELNDVYSQIEGNFVGLGIELKSGERGLFILRVIPSSPAESGGIKAGDYISAVDGQSTRDMSSDAAADLLQGPEGSFVTVTVETPGQQPRELRIRRAQVEVPSVSDLKVLDPAAGICYFRLNSFQKTTAKDLDNALWQLHRSGMKSLVLDLRGNPGGLLTAAVEAVDKFIEHGIIVSTRGRSTAEDYTYRAHASGTWKMPLVVLIDGDSASASEIFAGAIRDHARGTIVGTRSYGKGSVQGIFSLRVAGAGVRLTTAKFYSPNGLPFVKVGVEPNVVVQSAARPSGDVVPQTSSLEDPVMSAALGIARSQIAGRQTQQLGSR